MPATVMDALVQLIGQNVSIALDGRTLTGVLASVTGTLTILATGAGVIYMNTANIRAVSVAGTTGASVAAGTAGTTSVGGL